MNVLRAGFLTLIFGLMITFGGIFIPQLGKQSIARKNKVTICHRPPDNPDNYQTIKIKMSALPEHLAHGDLICACDPDGDGFLCDVDQCDNDPTKIEPGQCGCGNPDTDTDGDGTADCNDLCPNGVVDSGEECDPPGGACDSDHDGINDSTCDDQCQCPTTHGVCGDGIVDFGETCDDGFSTPCGICNATCSGPGTGSVCGDGILCPDTEACDDGFNTPCGTCDATCSGPGTGSVCGDGILCPDTEACDDGSNTPCGTCDATCSGPGTGSVCGDGILCPDTESCDDGNNVNGDGCQSDCALPNCGNGNVDVYEQCDPPGNQCDSDQDGINDSACDIQCQCPIPPAGCGDATVDPDEQCDDGNRNNGDGCRANCTLEICGDGIKDPHEQCDDGNDINDDNCTNGCLLPNCGNGVEDPLEECDDGNNVDGDGCHGDCTIEGCGDGIIDSEVFVTDGNLSFFIYTYEASRPDADSVQPGVADYRACSSAGRLPWVSVTWTEADAACTAAGKRLCTEEEWQLACEGTAGNMFPYGDVYDPMACNGKDYDPDCSPPDTDMVLPTGTDYGCPIPVENSCESEFGAFDMSGNVKEWTATQVSAAPPIYRIRGGSYENIEGGLTCQFDFVSAAGSFSFVNLGFRCCRDPQCSDGIDNDGDMKIDFPADPDCTSSTDDDEAA